jgi:hypothetical protein
LSPGGRGGPSAWDHRQGATARGEQRAYRNDYDNDHHHARLPSPPPPIKISREVGRVSLACIGREEGERKTSVSKRKEAWPSQIKRRGAGGGLRIDEVTSERVISPK